MYQRLLIRQLLLFVFVVAFSGILAAQDNVYSQFYSSPLALNPAFAGVSGAPRLSAIYRRQWSGPGLKSPTYETYAAGYEHFVESINSGFGLFFQKDDQGEGWYKVNHFLATYAYRLRFSEALQMKIGIEVGFLQTTVDWSSLIFFDQLDPLNGATDPGGNPYPTQEVLPEDGSRTLLDIGTGLLVYGRHFYGGVTLRHLNTNKDLFIDVNDNLTKGIPLFFSAHTGTQINLNRRNNRKKSAFISPNLLYVQQGDLGQITGGTYAGLGMFFAGVWYRHAFTNADAVIFSGGVSKDILKIGYAYDYTVSALGNYTAVSGGTHEISLILNFGESSAYQQRKYSNRYNDCLNLFR